MVKTQKNKGYGWISYGDRKIYIQRINSFGKKHWYDLYANKKVSRSLERKLNKERGDMNGRLLCSR